MCVCVSHHFFTVYMANDSRKDERDRAAHPSQSIISNDNKGGSALRGTEGGGGLFLTEGSTSMCLCAQKRHLEVSFSLPHRLYPTPKVQMKKPIFFFFSIWPNPKLTNKTKQNGPKQSAFTRLRVAF